MCTSNRLTGGEIRRRLEEITRFRLTGQLERMVEHFSPDVIVHYNCTQVGLFTPGIWRGRAAFLTGQHGIRSGLTKVGFPGAPMGMSQLDPSIGGLLKELGYATGQFGKNHVGDRNESLPTVNGFDEFLGNLYHLNAEEEPELPDYPKNLEYRAKFGPRGVLKCKATDKDDETVDPRFGKIGKQTIEDTGPLTKRRMETIDDETSAAAIDYMKRQSAVDKPFFVWFNSTRMHLRTHVRAEHRGATRTVTASTSTA